MKFNEKHKDLFLLISGKPVKEDVEINGVVYRISSLKNEDHTWITEGLENTDSTLLLVKKRKDRFVAAGIIAIGPKNGDLINKIDMFEFPDSEYGTLLRKSDLMLNAHLSEMMLEVVQSMDEKVVTLLYQKITELNKKIESAIEEATPFLKAQAE